MRNTVFFALLLCMGMNGCSSGQPPGDVPVFSKTIIDLKQFLLKETKDIDSTLKFDVGTRTLAVFHGEIAGGIFVLPQGYDLKLTTNPMNMSSDKGIVYIGDISSDGLGSQIKVER